MPMDIGRCFGMFQTCPRMWGTRSHGARRGRDRHTHSATARASGHPRPLQQHQGLPTSAPHIWFGSAASWPASQPLQPSRQPQRLAVPPGPEETVCLGGQRSGAGMAVGCGVLLLLGALLGASRGRELSSEEERQALMLKHLQEVLQLPDMEGEGSPEMTLTELAPEGGTGQEEEDGEGAPIEGDMNPSGPAPTTLAPQPEEDGFTYVFSRLDSLDAAVHRLNVQFHTMDLRVAQFSQGLAELRGRLAETQEALSALVQTSTRNRHDIGKIDGCLRGRRIHAKCFLIFREFEGYEAAQGLCQHRGGNLAMPADEAELAALRRYLHQAFQPFNWPAWVGIHDRRAEGLWLYENGQRVSFFDWYRDPLVSQPNGGALENCVSLSSDDGKWWDNACSRRMYYVCEFRL